MNEVIFLLHILAALFFLGLCVRFGKTALVVYVAMSGVLANLFVVKQIQLFGLNATASDVFAIGGILGLNLLQELFGTEAAKRAIRASFAALLFFACMSQIHLLYLPGVFDVTQPAFEAILGSAPRIVVASIGVYYLVQRLDLLFFTMLKRTVAHFGVRVLFSLLLSQAFDTALFSFFGLYRIVESIFEIMVVSFAVKCAVIACSSFLASALKRLHRKESYGAAI